MELLLKQYSVLIHRLRRKNPNVKVEELNQFFNHIVLFIRNVTYTNKRTNALELLTIICNDLPTTHTLQLFNHPVLINHPIFLYIGRTLEMLLTKSNHWKSILMKNSEEDCFYSLSYFISQLCLYRNETIKLFYGSISDEIPLITEKINIRDETIDENSRKSNALAEKPNRKVSSLAPTAPQARPIEERPLDITNIPHRRKFPEPMISSTDKTVTEWPTLPTDLPSKKYQDIFLTKSFFDKLHQAIDDLSRNDYSPYHIKYKVIDRLVHLCSHLNMVDDLFNPIIECLRSKFYRQAFITIESEQVRLTPKQFFFTYQCSQFLIQHEFQQQDQIPHLLCQTMIEVTQPILDQILPNNDATIDPGIALHALRCHLELLNSLSLTSTGRRYFLQSSIVDQMLSTLRHNVIVSNGLLNEEMFHAGVGIIANALMLLYNLAYEKPIFSMLKQQDLQDIYSQFEPSKNPIIQFALKTLADILSEEQIDEDNEPMELKKYYIEYLQKIVVETKEMIRSGNARNIKERDRKSKHVAASITSFFDTLLNTVKHLSTNGYPSNQLIYRDTSRRVRVCTIQETDIVESLLDPVLACLDSSFYLHVFENIDLKKTKVASRSVTSSHNLAEKHLFFMRDCPAFLFCHDHKRYEEVVDLLSKKMFDYTTIIFEMHLSILLGDQGKKDLDANTAARIEALSYHMKMLTHFTQKPSLRQAFLQTSIIDQILLILKDESLYDHRKPLPDVKFAIIEQSLILLYNLASEKTIYSKLKTENMLEICFKLRLFKHKIIHFVSHILTIVLDKEAYEHLYRTDLLSKTSIEYIEKSVEEPKQLHQGIKLDALLKNVKIFVQDDTFVDNIVAEKDNITVITKCVYTHHPDNTDSKMTQRIQKRGIQIVWRILSHGTKISKKFKENDLFIDQLLVLSTEASDQIKEVVDRIIWRLGSVEVIRSELQIQKEGKQDELIVEDQLPSNSDWDESIPYDLLISFSNNVTDKVLTLKIYDRLIKKDYRVFIEKQGKHRLKLMQQAIEKQKPILVCLSKNYRSAKVCMAELEYAKKQSSPIIPVIVESTFKVQGWLQHLLGEKEPIDMTQKKFSEGFTKLCYEIEKLKSSD